MSDQKSTIGNDSEKLLFTCSGGSNVGEIADRAARKLYREGVIQMSCIIAIGGKIESLLDRTKKASRVIALDGCEKDCVSRTLKNAGIKNYTHIRLNDAGMVKGGARVDETTIDKAVQHVKEIIKKEK